ncbi:MAG: phage terminase large subunit [Candidatus Dormiibacterota bacterium]
MNPLALHAAGALDPLVLAERIGLTPDPWQEKILRHPHQRDLLNCHRQSGKTTTAALVAVHTAIYKPKALVLIVAPSLRQSQELHRVVRTVHGGVGRTFEDEESSLSLTLENGSRVVCLPSDSATIRGYSAVDLAIFDESSRVSDETYEAITPMLSVSRGRILALSTPFGRRGWWYRASRSGNWRVTTVPATDCSRIDPEYLAQERAEHGDLVFRSEWLCEFVDQIGQMFSTDDIDAIFQPAELGAIPPGALFSGLEGRSSQPRIVDAVPARPEVSADCYGSDDGHHRWDENYCLACHRTRQLLIGSA